MLFRSDGAVRELLANGLFTTHYHSKDEENLIRRDALLDELRALNLQHPDDGAVRKHLAGSLNNTQIHSKDENNLIRRDALLEELRALAKRHPDDSVLAEIMAEFGDS